MAVGSALSSASADMSSCSLKRINYQEPVAGSCEVIAEQKREYKKEYSEFVAGGRLGQGAE